MRISDISYNAKILGFSAVVRTAILLLVELGVLNDIDFLHKAEVELKVDSYVLKRFLEGKINDRVAWVLWKHFFEGKEIVVKGALLIPDDPWLFVEELAKIAGGLK